MPNKQYQYTIDGKKFDVDIGEIAGQTASVTVNGKNYQVEIAGNSARPAAAKTIAPKQTTARAPAAAAKPQPKVGAAHACAEGEIAVYAPLPGLIIELKVGEGDSVDCGQTLMTMEAMKMENNIPAPTAGVVKAIHVASGSEVSNNALLATIEGA